MRADVRICDRTRIDLASDHKSSTLDSEILLPIAREKFRNRFFRNASHYIDAPTYFLRIGFQPSHGGVIWLPGFRKLRIGEIDPLDIAQVRRTSWALQQHCSRPTGFYSKSESGMRLILFEMSPELSLTLPGRGQISIAEKF